MHGKQKINPSAQIVSEKKNKIKGPILCKLYFSTFFTFQRFNQEF